MEDDSHAVVTVYEPPGRDQRPGVLEAEAARGEKPAVSPWIGDLFPEQRLEPAQLPARKQATGRAARERTLLLDRALEDAVRSRLRPARQASSTGQELGRPDDSLESSSRTGDAS